MIQINETNENINLSITGITEDIKISVVESNEVINISVAEIGIKGDKGDIGVQGIKGDTGEKGDTGYISGATDYIPKFVESGYTNSNIINSDNFTLINGVPNITGINPVTLQIRGTQTSSNWTSGATFATLQFNSTDTSGVGAISRGEISMNMTDAIGSYSDMVFDTSGIERLRIAGNGGNIGLGTGPTPTEKLTIRTNTARIRLEAATAPTSYYSIIENNYSATNPFNIFAKDHFIFGSKTLTSIQSTYLSAYRDINFATGAISTPTISDVRMVIKSGGNVLIGTTTDNGIDALQTTGSILSTLDSTFNGIEVGTGGGTGAQNTVVGYQTLLNATTGISNVALGYKSLTFLSGASSQNVSIGTNAGRFIADGTTSLISSNNSVFLGFGTKASGDGQTNQTVLGFNQTGLGSNSTIIGGFGNLKTAIVGRLMLGSIVDDGINQLQVTGNIKGTVILGGTATSDGINTLRVVGSGIFTENYAGVDAKLTLRNAQVFPGAGTSLNFEGFYKHAIISASGAPSSTTGGDLRLQTYFSDTTINEGITLNRRGRVMINHNTDDTINQLQISGSVKATSSVQVGDNILTASATNVGALRYRSDANNSYVDMSMQTGTTTYGWVNIVKNNW